MEFNPLDGLYNHLLAARVAGRPGKLEALAAVSARHLDGEPVRHVIGRGCRRVVLAQKTPSAVAARLGVQGIGNTVVVYITDTGPTAKATGRTFA